MKIIPNQRKPQIGDVYYLKLSLRYIYISGQYKITKFHIVDNGTHKIPGIIFHPIIKNVGYWDSVENFYENVKNKTYKFIKNEKVIEPIQD